MLALKTHDFERIGQIGIQKWFDRQLNHSYLWLLGAFACVIISTIVFRLLPGDTVLRFQLKVLLVCITAIVCWLAWARYAGALKTARLIENMRLCPECRYPSFSVVKVEVPGLHGMPSRLMHDLDDEGLLVSCRRCHHRWRWGQGVDTYSGEGYLEAPASAPSF